MTSMLFLLAHFEILKPWKSRT